MIRISTTSELPARVATLEAELLASQKQYADERQTLIELIAAFNEELTAAKARDAEHTQLLESHANRIACCEIHNRDTYAQSERWHNFVLGEVDTLSSLWLIRAARWLRRLI